MEELANKKEGANNIITKQKKVMKIEYFRHLIDKCILHDKDLFTNKNINLLDEEQANFYINLLESKEFKKLNWTEKLKNRIKDTHLII